MALLSTAALGLACVFAPTAQAESGFFGQFVDPVDGYFDASEYLERGGFVPLPLIVTEPAVDGGVGLIAAFVGPPKPGSQNQPSRTALGFVATGNDSRILAGLHSGSLFDDRLRYKALLAGGTVNLDFFPDEDGNGLPFRNEATYAQLGAQWRVGDSDFRIGPSASILDNTVTADFGGENGDLAGQLTQDVRLVSLGLTLHYDSRDTLFTPRNGVNAVFEVNAFDENLGSDVEYNAYRAFAAGFYSPDADWTIAGMAEARANTGDAPFFMEPSISLRGVPLNRYQGSRVLSTEVELRRQLHPRWAVVGFVGYGQTDSDGATYVKDDSTVQTYGAGVRYRLARKMGLDLGVDVSQGPEEPAINIQLGHAWAQRMD